MKQYLQADSSQPSIAVGESLLQAIRWLYALSGSNLMAEQQRRGVVTDE